VADIQVIVHRDSVCMGDDIDAPHEKRFLLNDESQINEIFRELAATGYIPSIAGFNEKWEVEANNVVVCSFGKNITNPDYCISPDTKINEVGKFNKVAKIKLIYFSAPN